LPNPKKKRKLGLAVLARGRGGKRNRKPDGGEEDLDLGVFFLGKREEEPRGRGGVCRLGCGGWGRERKYGTLGPTSFPRVLGRRGTKTASTNRDSRGNKKSTAKSGGKKRGGVYCQFGTL